MSEKSSYRKILKEFWNYDTFRPLQEEIIQSILDGKDTFALLPTGGGKSICYQVPAVTMQGICIVVSPLISLMSDQTADLKKRGIKAVLITSSMSKREIDQALDNAVYGNYKLLYISPERLQSELFIERFKRMNISFIAVDEAHCISQWGYDFRPAYLGIRLLRDYVKVPMLALTATATTKVVDDIIQNLQLAEVQEFRKSFARSNIFFEVRKADNKMTWVRDLALNEKGSGIIYVRNRRKCKEISDLLNHEGIISQYYHAGRDHKNRARVQDAWMKNECNVIVATNAFGMGIDKADVRFVIHWDLPDSLEAFYQEAGRAGRDGKESKSLILYSESDVLKLHENFKLTFPPVDEIKDIYLKLAIYYQLAKGSGYMESFPFHLNDFCERFKLLKLSVFHSLKQLEQSGFISLSAGVYHPSLIRIEDGKNDLITFREQNSAYADLIGYLLRAYSGILEQEVKIDESEVARKTGIKEGEVLTKLQYLHKTKLISYKAKSDVPSLTFLTERKVKDNLNLSEKDYLKRKEAHWHRLEAMLRYVEGIDDCRTNVILKYFDEEVDSPCSHCDKCLNRKKGKITHGNLRKSILNSVSKDPVQLEELYELFPDSSKEDIQSCCRDLCKSEMLKLIGNNKFVRA